MPGRVEADMRYWLPPSASGSSLGVHPGHDWGWFFPVSPLETYGPWTLWPSAQRRTGDIRVPEDEVCVRRGVETAEASCRRIYISGDAVPNHYVQHAAGAVECGRYVEEPNFPDTYADVDEDVEPGVSKGDGLVYKTYGRWLPWRRVFNEYDFWEGYRNRPIIAQADNTHIHIAANSRARIWARWLLQEGCDGSITCAALFFEAGPGGLRKDARFPSGTFGPYADYASCGAMRHVIGPCGRHVDGRALALAPLSYDNIATLSIESGPWAVIQCQVRSAGGVAMLCQRWCVASVQDSIIGGMGGAKNIFWARLLQEEEDAWHCDTRLAADGLAACDRAEVTVKASVFEDCGYNAGDCAHAWNDAVLSLEKCVFRYSSYGLGIDDGACVSVSRSTLHSLHFEAFYCGSNSGHADMTLLDNTVFGPLWWEQLEENEGGGGGGLEHNASRSRPGRLTERGNKVHPRVRTCMQRMSEIGGEAAPVDAYLLNDPRFERYVAQTDREMSEIVRQMEEAHAEYRAGGGHGSGFSNPRWRGKGRASG